MSQIDVMVMGWCRKCDVSGLTDKEDPRCWVCDGPVQVTDTVIVYTPKGPDDE